MNETRGAPPGRQHPLEARVPPPLVALAAGALAWALARAVPVLGVELPARRALAGACAFFGIAIALAGVLEFRRARTTIHPRHPEHASALVCGGVYRLTRNPMYVGIALVLLGWAAWLAHPLALAGPVLLVAYLTRFQVVPEERALAARFGAEFEAYRRRVRRWV